MDIKGLLKTAEIQTRRKIIISQLSSLINLSADLVMDDSYYSLSRFNVIGSIRSVTLPSTTINSATLVLQVDSGSAFGITIQTTNTTMTSTLSLYINESAVFVYNGSNWNFVCKTEEQHPIIQCYSTLNTNLNVTTPVVIAWDGEDFKDTGYTHSTAIINNSKIYVSNKGIYHFDYTINVDNVSNSRTTIEAGIRVNGSSILSRSISYDYMRNTTDDKLSCSSSFKWELQANDYIELIARRDGSSGTARLIPNENIISLELKKRT